MSVGKPMGKKMKDSIRRALEVSQSGKCTSIVETENGTEFHLKVEKKVIIEIPEK